MRALQACDMDDEQLKQLNRQAHKCILEYFERKKSNPTIVVAPSMLPVSPPVRESKFKYQMDNNCLVKATTSGVIGYGMGGLFGVFMSSMRADSSMHLSAESSPYSLKNMYREFKSNAKSTAKNFGQFSFVLVGTECVIEKYRGKHDITNEILAGILVGAVGGLRGSPKLALFGGLSLGAFTGVIGMFLAGH